MTSPQLLLDYRFEDVHGGTEHLAINNTFIRRFLTRLALHTTARLRPQCGVCFPISKHKIVKTGFRIHLAEGATLKYLAEHTSVPVPKVYCSFVHKKRAYIVMERIRGEELSKAWKRLSEESLEGIFQQLREIFQNLRALTPPEDTGVENCVGGSLYDSRIRTRRQPRFGPFRTIQDFHLWLRRDLKPTDLSHREKDQDWQDLQDMMARQDGPCAPPKLTHGDLNPSNIIVRGKSVVGIIDWEFSGWYPDYWEYTAAWFGNVMRTDWQGMLDKILDRPQPEDLKMEETRNKWWGE